MRMKFIGPHVSIAGGVYNAPLNAQKTGAKAFGMFMKNQKQWKAKPLTEEDTALFSQNMADTELKKEHVIVHDSYLINLGNPEKEMWEKSLHAFFIFSSFLFCRFLSKEETPADPLEPALEMVILFIAVNESLPIITYYLFTLSFQVICNTKHCIGSLYSLGVKFICSLGNYHVYHFSYYRDI